VVKPTNFKEISRGIKRQKYDTAEENYTLLYSKRFLMVKT